MTRFLEQESDGLIGRFKEGNTTHMLRLVNKSPVWNESTHALYAFRPALLRKPALLCFLKARSHSSSTSTAESPWPPSRTSRSSTSETVSSIQLPSVLSCDLCLASTANYILLQFGRVAENMFTMDYNHPLTALQAWWLESAVCTCGHVRCPCRPLASC